VVQSYALISVGTKVSISNTNSEGSRSSIFSTQSNVRLVDNVSTLFGSKFAFSLVPIDLDVPIECGSTVHVVEDDKIALSDTSTGNMILPSSAPSTERTIRVSGLVSKVGIGVGRCDNDRQFMFCNSRPVDLSRFAKALNEVWRRYEMKQKPAFVLNVHVPSGLFDINMTPDKREVLIVQEQLVIEKLKAVVDALYAPVRNTMQLNQGGIAVNGTGLFAAMHSSNYSSAMNKAVIIPDDSHDRDEKKNCSEEEHVKHADLRPSSDLQPSFDLRQSSLSLRNNKSATLCSDVVVRPLISSNVLDVGSTEKNCDPSTSNRQIQRVSSQSVEEAAIDNASDTAAIWKVNCDEVVTRFKQKRCAVREYRSSLKKRAHSRGGDGMDTTDRSIYKCDGGADDDDHFDVSLEAQAPHPQSDRSQPRVLSKKVCHFAITVSVYFLSSHSLSSYSTDRRCFPECVSSDNST